MVACNSDLARDLRGVIESTVELLLFGAEGARGDLSALLEEAGADVVIVEASPASAATAALARALHRQQRGTRLFVLTEVPAAPQAGGENDQGNLTARERQVLELLAGGNDLKTISRMLGISLHTTRGHVKNLLSKLDAHSQLEAVVIATREGYLSGQLAR